MVVLGPITLPTTIQDPGSYLECQGGSVLYACGIIWLYTETMETVCSHVNVLVREQGHSQPVEAHDTFVSSSQVPRPHHLSRRLTSFPTVSPPSRLFFRFFSLIHLKRLMTDGIISSL